MKLITKFVVLGFIAATTSAEVNNTPSPSHLRGSQEFSEDEHHATSQDSSTLEKASDHVQEGATDWRESSESQVWESDLSDTTDSFAKESSQWASDETSDAHEALSESDSTATDSLYKTDHTEEDTEWFEEDNNQDASWTSVEEIKRVQEDSTSSSFSNARDSTHFLDDHVLARDTSDTNWERDQLWDTESAAFAKDLSDSTAKDSSDWSAWNTDARHANDAQDWTSFRDADWHSLNKQAHSNEDEYKNSKFADYYGGLGYGDRRFGGGYGPGYGGYYYDAPSSRFRSPRRRPSTSKNMGSNYYTAGPSFYYPPAPSYSPSYYGVPSYTPSYYSTQMGGYPSYGY